MESIYLDHNATTPVDPEVVEAMHPFQLKTFGNASSVHNFGRDAKVALENSREKIASIINCEPQELFFTSGGTESDNIAVMGTAFHFKGKKNHLIVGAAEHPAVLESAEYLQSNLGFDLNLLPVDKNGCSSAELLKSLLKNDTFLVSVMHANNETGAINNISELASAVSEKQCLFHTDAVQSIGKIKVDVKEMGVDLLSLTGHKIYGAKGTGALFIKSGQKISPLFYGGSHEKKRRPGTENIAGIVGLAKTLEIAEKKRVKDFKKISELADYFMAGLNEKIPDVHLNSPKENRIPQTLNVSFVGAEGESLVLGLDIEGVAVSSGSACASGAVEPSHVLTAMGIPALTAQGAIRFSMGRSTTKEQLDYVLEKLPPIVERLRSISPIYNKTK
ncbi:MAG: cysteine desulfurase NifS [Candidatus Zixiibacteriota bacterium]|nr:MAG: cysteine desulfurase NifS [candidate division Zixibacteria bacterium]